MTPPPAKRPRVIGSADGEDCTSSSGQRSPERRVGGVSDSPSNSAMQSNGGGVIHANGTTSDFAVNGLSGGIIKSNGCEGVVCEGEEVGSTTAGGEDGVHAVPVGRKRKQRQLSSKDTDIVRLVGQHLREMGFK